MSPPPDGGGERVNLLALLAALREQLSPELFALLAGLCERAEYLEVTLTQVLELLADHGISR